MGVRSSPGALFNMFPYNNNYKGTSGIYSHPITMGSSYRGFTGTGNPHCYLCHRPGFQYGLKYFNIDFEIQKYGEGIGLCPQCANLTEIQLENFKELPLDELPLHLHEPNIFVFHFIKKRLNRT